MKELLNVFFKKCEPLITEYQRLYPTCQAIDGGDWKLAIAPSALIAEYQTNIHQYFLWENLLGKKTIAIKQGFDVHVYTGSVINLQSPIVTAQIFLNKLDKAMWCAYNRSTQKNSCNINRTYRLGEVTQNQNLLTLADRLDIMLNSLATDNTNKLIRELIQKNIDLFNEAKNEPPPKNPKEFSAHLILSMDKKNLSGYLSTLQKSCIASPVHGEVPTPTPVKKDKFIISLASDVYEFYHTFTDISHTLDLSSADFIFLNKRDKNIYYWVDTLLALGIDFPTYDTPHAIAIAVWQHNPTTSLIYLSGMDRTYIVDTHALKDLHKNELYSVIKAQGENGRNSFLEVCKSYNNYLHAGIYPLTQIKGVLVKNAVGRLLS